MKRISTVIRKRYLVPISFILIGTCFFVTGHWTALRITNLDVERTKFSQTYGIKSSYIVQNTITTAGCIIPGLRPNDKSITAFVKYPKDIPQCRKANLALLGKNRTMIWIRFESHITKFYDIADYDIVTCCYRPFYRPQYVKDNTSIDIDNRVDYDKCVLFNDVIEVSKDHEFVRVNCSVVGIVTTRPIYEQFFLFAPAKKFIKHGVNDEITNNVGYNILILGIDSVSRLNFIRTMPRMENYLHRKGGIQMIGLNRVGYNSFPNIMPMLMGVKDTELVGLCLSHPKATFDNCSLLWEKFKEAGYYTAYGEDATHLATFKYHRGGFGAAPVDYYLKPFLTQSEKCLKSTSKMCMNDIYYYQVLLDYIKDLTITLKTKRLFGFFWENTITHDKLNYPMRIDNDYVKVFEYLEDSGYLNQTIVFLVSDHGMRWGPMRHTKQGRLEENLPFLYILTPPSFRMKFKKAFKNLKSNSDRLTTFFDMHETMSDLVDLSKIKDSAIAARSLENYSSNRGISLFLPIPNNRTCRTADIDHQWCTCRKEVRISTSHRRVLDAADVLVEQINNRFRDYPQCATLILSDVLDAVEIQVGDAKDDKDFSTEYLIAVQTAPSGAIFEGLVRQTSAGWLSWNSWSVVGDPARLNLYGEQSHCVEDYALKPYCYCV